MFAVQAEEELSQSHTGLECQGSKTDFFIIKGEIVSSNLIYTQLLLFKLNMELKNLQFHDIIHYLYFYRNN